MLNVQDSIKARLYQNEDVVIQDALRHLLRARPDLRIQLAAYRYRAEGLSLARAASLAGVSWAQMREILLERGWMPRSEPETEDKAIQEAQVLRGHFQSRP